MHTRTNQFRYQWCTDRFNGGDRAAVEAYGTDRHNWKTLVDSTQVFISLHVMRIYTDGLIQYPHTSKSRWTRIWATTAYHLNAFLLGPFFIQGVSGVLFNFHFFYIEIHVSILRRLIWVHIVCIGPIKKTLG